MPTTIAKLTEQFDFDAGTDGYITMGPIRGINLDGLMSKMDSHGVFAFTETCDVTAEHTSGGDLYITACSEEVTGFFFDDEASEAATSDIEDLLLELLEDGQTLKIDGAYPDGQDGSIVTSSRFMRRGDEILRDIDRTGFGATGKRTPVMSLTEVRDFEMSMITELSKGKVVSMSNFRRVRAH